MLLIYIMESTLNGLREMKANLPVNCTHANLIKLTSCFAEYKRLVNGLPEGCPELKKLYQKNFRSLESALSAITDKANSLKDSKYYFKLALQQLHMEIDRVAACLTNESEPG